MSGSEDHAIPVKVPATNKYKRKADATTSLPDGCSAEAYHTTKESPEDFQNEDDSILPPSKPEAEEKAWRAHHG